MASNFFSDKELTYNNYYYLRCWFILNSDGKKVFKSIFDWGFKKPSNEIKASLFQLPGYTNTRYRSDFNASQRNKIELGNIEEFDIGLLYLLIQRICSLPPPSDPSWRSKDVNNLPGILYQIKNERNTLAHSNVEMTEVIMINSIKEYKVLFDVALDLAAVMYSIEKDILAEAKDAVKDHILYIQNSSNATIENNASDIVDKGEEEQDEEEYNLAKALKHFFKGIKVPTEVNKFKDTAIETKLTVCSSSKIISDEAKELFNLSEEKVKDMEPVIKNLSIDARQCLSEVENVNENIKPIIQHSETVIKKYEPEVKHIVKDVQKFFKF